MPGYRKFKDDLTAHFKGDAAKQLLFERLIDRELSNPGLWIPEGVRSANQRFWIVNYSEYKERIVGK